jgi:transposase
MHHGYWTIRKALASAAHQPYTLSQAKEAPKLGPYKEKINKLLKQERSLPRKQRFTTHKIYELMEAEGYSGSESNLRRYVGKKRGELKRPPIFIPLQYEPGQDAQVDWGEAVVIMKGERVKAQLFVMRLCYSRRTFVMAFPTQRQEAFFSAHMIAFDFFGGVPHTITYDNLKAAVDRVLKGRNRQEQKRFITFRSHYLFESRFCTPGEGHEKGGVEHGVKYVRQNYLVPLPEVRDYAQLNTWLRERSLQDDQRQVSRQQKSIGAMWADEQPYLRSLPATDLSFFSQNPIAKLVALANSFVLCTFHNICIRVF